MDHFRLRVLRRPEPVGSPGFEVGWEVGALGAAVTVLADGRLDGTAPSVSGKVTMGSFVEAKGDETILDDGTKSDDCPSSGGT